jgi:hypothetical protein
MDPSTLHEFQFSKYKLIIKSAEHLTRHRLGATQGLSVVNFEISLRSAPKDEKMRQLERAFSSIPFKDKGEFPKQYPKFKEELVKLKEMRATGKPIKYETAL